MVFKIKTCKKTMDIFSSIGGSEQLQPFVLCKLAMALSIKSQLPLGEADFQRDTQGLELNRQTITGEFDTLFKCLIENREGYHIDEDEYFPKYVKAHIDRGAPMLQAEHRYGRDFYIHLVNTDVNI